jgi:hypothetical protein
MRQLIKRVKADNHDDLLIEIKKLIDYYCHEYFLAKINYFNMIEEEEGKPTAFLLFNELKENQKTKQTINKKKKEEIEEDEE